MPSAPPTDTLKARRLAARLDACRRAIDAHRDALTRATEAAARDRERMDAIHAELDLALAAAQRGTHLAGSPWQGSETARVIPCPTPSRSGPEPEPAQQPARSLRSGRSG
jgi:hypothetical protein